jgi:FecR protein
MSRARLVSTLLILASVTVWGTQALAQAPNQPPATTAQPASPTAPQAQPSTARPAAPTATQQPQQDTDPVGSVATLQGSASVTHNNASSALKLSQSIYKGDAVQTGTDGTMGITFDDDTTFTLKPNSQMTVDDFVYQKGGASNAATFNILRGTAAFVAAEVAHTGNMKIETPTSTLGIRGTTGLVEVPAPGAANATGGVSIKLYPDSDGKVGRIEVFGRDGSQLGILNRGATGFAVRAGAPGAPQRFSAVPLQISAQEAERDRSFTRQAFSTQLVGRQINIQRRTLQQRNQQLRPNQQRPNLQQQRNELRPGQQRPNLQQQRNELRPGQQLPNHQLPTPQRAGQLPTPGQKAGLQHVPGAPGATGTPVPHPLALHPPTALPKPSAGPRKPPPPKKQSKH